MAKGIYSGKQPTVTKTGYTPNAPVKKTPAPASHDAAAHHDAQQSSLEAQCNRAHMGNFNPHSDHVSQQTSLNGGK